MNTDEGISALGLELDIERHLATEILLKPYMERKRAGELDATSRGTPPLLDDEAYMAGWLEAIASIKAADSPTEREIKWSQGDTRSGI